MRRAGTSEYCTAHRCEKCDAANSYGSPFCLSHKCKHDECPLLQKHPSEYCSEHVCKRCSAEVCPGSQFCVAHKCARADEPCNAERAHPSPYCNAHEPAPPPFPSVKIRIGCYEISGLLGSGSFSQVRKGINLETRELVAIKVVSLTALSEMRSEDLLSSEIDLLRSLQHENVVGASDTMKTQKCVCIVMEYLSGGELFDLISSQGVLKPDVCLKYYKDLLKGMCYLHSRSVAHRDIKPENLLIEGDKLMIADLGFAAYQAEDAKLNEALGTPEYQAPDVKPGNPYNGFSADMWSCGVVLFTMVQGYLPFDGEGNDAALDNQIRKGINVPPSVAEGPRQLIKRLVVYNPAKRPHAYDVLFDTQSDDNLAWARLTPEELGAPSTALLQRPNHVPPPSKKSQDTLALIPVAQAEHESFLFTEEEKSTWTLAKLLEGAAGFIESFGKPTPQTHKENGEHVVCDTHNAKRAHTHTHTRTSHTDARTEAGPAPKQVEARCLLSGACRIDTFPTPSRPVLSFLYYLVSARDNAAHCNHRPTFSVLHSYGSSSVCFPHFFPLSHIHEQTVYGTGFYTCVCFLRLALVVVFFPESGGGERVCGGKEGLEGAKNAWRLCSVYNPQ